MSRAKPPASCCDHAHKILTLHLLPQSIHDFQRPFCSSAPIQDMGYKGRKAFPQLLDRGCKELQVLDCGVDVASIPGVEAGIHSVRWGEGRELGRELQNVKVDNQLSNHFIALDPRGHFLIRANLRGA
eukprot:jgi/Chlat1/1724/Chrsp13S02161